VREGSQRDGERDVTLCQCYEFLISLISLISLSLSCLTPALGLSLSPRLSTFSVSSCTLPSARGYASFQCVTLALWQGKRLGRCLCLFFSLFLCLFLCTTLSLFHLSLSYARRPLLRKGPLGGNEKRGEQSRSIA